jgi:(1->4)-alpha-D-glucan 1-alpha-D-glucosylmutase
LRRGLREVVAHLHVYRTYADDKGTPSRDRREIALAVARARRAQPQIQPTVFDFIQAVLCGSLGPAFNPKAIAAAIGRFQQYTGPVMAKGLEDTALYRYNRLVALNEVGAHPDRFNLSVAAFHDSNRRRLATHPHCLIATSTHDTKRGEDTRAIISAITDEPGLWETSINQWRAMLTAAGTDSIHPNDLYLFFQMLIGGWALEGGKADLPGRLKAAMIKSLREARERSDWSVNNTAYETRVTDFIDMALSNAPFLASVRATREPLQAIGRRKALIQVALKLTIPGVPDIYRGAEDWEQSFVDPDNRRPLDFAALAERRSSPLAGRDDKLMLVQSLLTLRRRLPALFAEGSYQAMNLGPHVLAFRRQYWENQIIVMADLSKRHDAGLPCDAPPLTTVAGSRAGPIWVLST